MKQKPNIFGSLFLLILALFDASLNLMANLSAVFCLNSINIDNVLRIYDFGNFLDKKGETYWTKIWRINGWKGKAYIGKNEEENRRVPSIHRQRTTAVNIETIHKKYDV